MKDIFARFGRRRKTVTERALDALEIEYAARGDGTYFVPGDINLANRELTSLPDLSLVSVGGSFTCEKNPLASLEGAPFRVAGNFDCSNTLLRTLEGAPGETGRDFCCVNTPLESLKGSPQRVGGYFSCTHATLGSLAHGPTVVGKGCLIMETPLKTLYGLPETFGHIVTNLGTFKSRAEVPAALTAPPADAWDDVSLAAPVAAGKPLRFARGVKPRALTMKQLRLSARAAS